MACSMPLPNSLDGTTCYCFQQLRQMRINELGKKVSDWEVKLKQQQQLYESVRSDRNLYSKNLIEAQDEIAEMKRKLKIMNHQIEQLKEDITAKVILPYAVNLAKRKEC